MSEENKLEANKPRTLVCRKCKTKETEIAFGRGLPGWVRISAISEIINGESVYPYLCSKCIDALCKWLEEK